MTKRAVPGEKTARNPEAAGRKAKLSIASEANSWPPPNAYDDCTSNVYQ